MPYFSDTEEVRKVMEALWEEIKTTPHIAEPLLKSKLIVQFHYREPEGRLTVDCSDGENMVIKWGEYEKKAIVEMFMKADVAHLFWQGEVNVPVYLISGRIVAKGPVNRALALLPVVKPAFQLYPAVIQDTLDRPLISA
jgi:hypothetical protein